LLVVEGKLFESDEGHAVGVVGSVDPHAEIDVGSSSIAITSVMPLGRPWGTPASLTGMSEGESLAVV
jgi:hypothetical protein